MPKSWIGSRYSGYSCTSSRLRKVASEVTGPGVTTCRLVNTRPRSASITKPVACEELFHSVSKARVESILMATTLWAMRSSVAAQGASSRRGAVTSSAATVAGRPAPGARGTPGSGVTAGAGGTLCATASPAANNIEADSNCSTRFFMDEPLEIQNQQPGQPQQHERREDGSRADVLGKSGQLVMLEPDSI